MIHRNAPRTTEHEIRTLATTSMAPLSDSQLWFCLHFADVLASVEHTDFFQRLTMWNTNIVVSPLTIWLYIHIYWIFVFQHSCSCKLTLQHYLQGGLAFGDPAEVAKVAVTCLRLFDTSPQSPCSQHLQSKRFCDPSFTGLMGDSSDVPLRPLLERLASGTTLIDLASEDTAQTRSFFHWVSAFRLVRVSMDELVVQTNNDSDNDSHIISFYFIDMFNQTLSVPTHLVETCAIQFPTGESGRKVSWRTALLGEPYCSSGAKMLPCLHLLWVAIRPPPKSCINTAKGPFVVFAYFALCVPFVWYVPRVLLNFSICSQFFSMFVCYSISYLYMIVMIMYKIWHPAAGQAVMQMQENLSMMETSDGFRKAALSWPQVLIPVNCVSGWLPGN